MIAVQPVQIAAIPSRAIATNVTVTRSTEIRLSTGYTRTLPEGSRWRSIGALPQGAVYQPVVGVFSIEGRHVHEAYLVIKDSHLQGFYLPAEGSFAPLSPPISLPLGEPS